MRGRYGLEKSENFVKKVRLSLFKPLVSKDRINPAYQG